MSVNSSAGIAEKLFNPEALNEQRILSFLANNCGFTLDQSVRPNQMSAVVALKKIFEHIPLELGITLNIKEGSFEELAIMILSGVGAKGKPTTLCLTNSDQKGGVGASFTPGITMADGEGHYDLALIQDEQKTYKQDARVDFYVLGEREPTVRRYKDGYLAAAPIGNKSTTAAFMLNTSEVHLPIKDDTRSNRLLAMLSSEY